MTLADERRIVEMAHRHWADGDIEGFLSCLTDDVVHNVNVDGQKVPYAASAIGKEDVRRRLGILRDTFEVQAFVIESLAHGPEYTHTRVLGFYKHKRTGERLDVTVHFHCYVRDGLIHRIEENHDAPYVEAFQRFVTYLEAAARPSGNSSDASP
jgi:ketosteroid isomerase-like protein